MGVECPDPLKIHRRVRECFDPLKMSHSSIQNCCITVSFTASRMDSWTLSLHRSCMLTMLPYLRLISSKQTVTSKQYLCCSTGLKLSWPKTKLQKVNAGDPSSTILIDHGSYAVLPTIDRLQLVWLTRGVDAGVVPGVSHVKKYD